MLVRASFTADSTLRSTIEAAQRSVVTAMAHADYPFPAVTRLVAPRPPLFTVAITMLVADRLQPPLPMVAPGEREGPEVSHAGLRLALLDVPQMEGQFDLLVELRQAAGGLSAVLKYDAAKFERATVERIGAAFTRFARQAVEDPEVRVAAVALVDPAQLAALLALGSGPGPALGPSPRAGLGAGVGDPT